MKELEKYSKDSEKQQLESVVKKQQQQEIKYLESLRPIKGHNLYKINVKTLKVSLAEYKENKTVTWHEALRIVSGEDKHAKDVIVEPNHHYISALNPESALRRYVNGKGSAKMNEKQTLKVF